MAIILGIDPGSRITGYGFIEAHRSSYQLLSCGLIQTQGGVLATRLGQIFNDLSALIEEYQPLSAGVEKVFVHRNVDTALKLGHARGAALVACANFAVPVHEYSPREIKQAIVGYGAAEKAQIQHMVTRLLGLSRVPKSDAADALAVALCHHYHAQTAERIAKAAGEQV
jgi:crossover junction endodeoxyribonuclease RuvC